MVCRLDRARSWYVVYCSERFLFYIMWECLLEKYISYTLYKIHILTIRFSQTFATHMKYVPNMPLCGITLSMLYFTEDHATSIQLWIFTIQTSSFQFQGPTSFSSPWLLDSSRSYCQNYCSNTGRTACFNLLGMLFQVTHNFFSFWEKKREKPRALESFTRIPSTGKQWLYAH